MSEAFSSGRLGQLDCVCMNCFVLYFSFYDLVLSVSYSQLSQGEERGGIMVSFFDRFMLIECVIVHRFLGWRTVVVYFEFIFVKL